jgi:hypothetical protein
MKKHWVNVLVLFTVVLALAACPTSSGGGSNPGNSDGSLQVKIILDTDDGKTAPHRSNVNVPTAGSVDLSIEYNKGSGWSAGQSLSLTYKTYLNDIQIGDFMYPTLKGPSFQGGGTEVATGDKLKVVITDASGATAEAVTTITVN